MIFYFSGTGNSRYAAKVIARVCDDELVSMNRIMRERIENPYVAQYAFDSEAPLVFVCPTHCWRMPRAVEQFIRESRFTGTKDVYFYLTCGSSTASAQKHAEALCRELHLNYMGLGSVCMPENYIAMFNSPSYDEAQGIIRAAYSQIESSGRLITMRKPLYDSNVGSFPALTKLNSIFYKLFVNDKKYYATDDCIICGRCKDICPTANIIIEDGRPTWNGNCLQCMACISICPKNAIEYGNISKNKRRYYLDIDGNQKK